MRVLVTGAYGLLGTELCSFLSRNGHDVLRQGRRGNADYRFDPGREAEVIRLVDQGRPEVVVNLVAATNVDACEAEPRMAYLANVRPVENLVRVLKESGVHLIHISTDQVYDGPGPHAEDDACPCNVYALSKYAGEKAAMAIDATVFRTNFVGKSRAPNRVSFTDWLVQSLRTRKSVTFFNDVLFSALHVSTLCQFIEQSIRVELPGIFNVGCQDAESKAEFALNLAQLLDLDASCAKVGRLQDVALAARRPLDMRLDVHKFEQAFGVKAPTMTETLELVAKDYDHG